MNIFGSVINGKFLEKEGKAEVPQCVSPPIGIQSIGFLFYFLIRRVQIMVGHRV